MELKTTAPRPNAPISGALAVGIAVLFSGCGKPPTLTVIWPQNDYSIKARTVAVKGRVIPAQSTVLISADETIGSGDHVIPDNNGNFVDQVQLPREGFNRITVTANDGDETASSSLTIIRILTDEEKAADARAKAAKAKAEAKAEAEAKAQDAAYSKTRAGRLCAKHPDWARDDCENVANNRIWVGMTLAMLKANRGQPDHATPSNYGHGTSWQWCWDDYTPSCFYGGGDGIITAYN
jgi:hypothetical protein